MNEPKVLVAVLIVFTWSIYQFTLVTTATVQQHQQMDDQQPQHILTTDTYGRKVSISNFEPHKTFKNIQNGKVLIHVGFPTSDWLFIHHFEYFSTFLVRFMSSGGNLKLELE